MIITAVIIITVKKVFKIQRSHRSERLYLISLWTINREQHLILNFKSVNHFKCFIRWKNLNQIRLFTISSVFSGYRIKYLNLKYLILNFNHWTIYSVSSGNRKTISLSKVLNLNNLTISLYFQVKESLNHVQVLLDHQLMDMAWSDNLTDCEENLLKVSTHLQVQFVEQKCSKMVCFAIVCQAKMLENGLFHNSLSNDYFRK